MIEKAGWYLMHNNKEVRITHKEERDKVWFGTVSGGGFGEWDDAGNDTLYEDEERNIIKFIEDTN